MKTSAQESPAVTAGRKGDMSAPKRILVIRLDRIGDLLLSTPVFSALRAAYPKAHIAAMVRASTAGVVIGNQAIDEVLVYDKEGRDRGLGSTIRYAWALRAKRFDTALILHPTVRSHLIPFIAGVRERVGYDRKWPLLLTKRVPHLKQLGEKHERDYALDLVRSLGVKPASLGLIMPVDDTSERKIAAELSLSGVRPDDRLIAVHPGASCPSKRWPAERFAEAACIAAKRHSAWIVVVAGESERVCGDRVAALSRKGGARVVNLSGATSVADLASVLRRSHVLISNDSGPVHIACAVGTPAVVIFGRHNPGISPKRWGPLGERDIVLHKDVGCDTCLAHRCEKGFQCLLAVSPDEAAEAASLLLAAKE